jgi:eukaryotic-like serine/threonine-protein kinase
VHVAFDRWVEQDVVALPDGLEIGDIVAGKYQILRVIGSGAMGVVVAAHHLNLDRTVALKFLVASALAHPDALARFAQEARAPARLASPHVVRVNDVGSLSNGTPYIELEYMEGSDLAARLRSGGRLPVDLAVDFVLQACDGIAEAHGLGIIHRDLKPANLFVVRGHGGAEEIKVLDFGISKAKASVTSTRPPGAGTPGGMSTSGGPIGSPCYMSPEQMQSARDIDVRTDIWSLGITLYELVTGELPFRGQSLVELYSEAKSQQPLCLRSRWPALPAGLEAVLSRCLQFDRQLRFPSVSELARALLPFASNRTGAYVQRIVAASRSPATPEKTDASRMDLVSSVDPMLKTRVSGAPEPVFVSAPVPHRTARAKRIMVAGAAVVALATWIGIRRAGALSHAKSWLDAIAIAIAGRETVERTARSEFRTIEPIGSRSQNMCLFRTITSCGATFPVASQTRSTRACEHRGRPRLPPWRSIGRTSIGSTRG